MNLPVIEDLNIPELVNNVSELAARGRLAVSDNNLVYLDVHDDYIHRLFPLFANQKIKNLITSMLGRLVRILVLFIQKRIFW